MRIELIWNEYNYFDYEKTLAIEEIEKLFHCIPESTDTGLRIDVQTSDLSRIGDLTYFNHAAVDGEVIITRQALLEASANGTKWGSSNSAKRVPRLSRQSTRYSAHGLHEYKGKFNPQIVHSLGNSLGLAEDGWVLDPFCGSGTTLLEARHNGWNCLGIDLNPLAVFVANAKVEATKASIKLLEEQTDSLAEFLENCRETELSTTSGQMHLPNSVYLERWFSKSALFQIQEVLDAINRIIKPKLRNIFKAILSDICRAVSLQDPGDLRIRRRKDPIENPAVIELYLDDLQKKIKTIVRARRAVQFGHSIQEAFVIDSRNCSGTIRTELEKHHRRRVDIIITSPPYATALPYIDTQRLSLCLLGLLQADNVRNTEQSLIGSREISLKERTAMEVYILENHSGLPRPVAAFCRDLLTAADHPEHGFRKRNVPALTYKYFADMSQMFGQLHCLLRRSGTFALVVGVNTTVMDGTTIRIDTPRFLGDIAESKGWNLEGLKKLDTYQRFDLHNQNSIKSEYLLLLKPGSRCS